MTEIGGKPVYTPITTRRQQCQAVIGADARAGSAMAICPPDRT